MSNKSRTVLALLTLTTLGACAADDVTSSVDDEPSLDDAGLTDERIAELRVPQAPGAVTVEDAAFTARMRAQADRAQRYLDKEVVPALDRALRDTAGVSYAALQAEVTQALQLGDPEATKAGLDRFFAERGAIIEAALKRMGTTQEAVGEAIRAAALDGEPAAPPAAKPQVPHGACGPGFQFEPFPPFFDAGTFVNGTNTSGPQNTSNRNGALAAQASVMAGWGNGGGWVRADNLPPFGSGATAVTTQLDFSWMSAELVLWVPAYSGGGVGVTIEMFDGGPSGTLIGSCRAPLLDRSIPIGYLFVNVPRSVVHTCVVHHPAGSGFITTKVKLDAYAAHIAPYGGFAQTSAAATVRSIIHHTCLD